MRPFAVERTRSGGVEVVAVEGQIDIATSPRLIASLSEAVAETERSLVVDLSAVDFMDSTGLALLLNAHRRVLRRGFGFAIVCPRDALMRVFKLTDLVDTLRVCPDRESAVRLAASS
jgi:anti-sigma B factor antagonist